MKVGVIGAGPAGITAAYELAKRGHEVEVFEAGDQVGGMAKSIELWGQTVDLGPHRFFSSDPRVNRVWLEAVAGRYAMVSRLTRIYYRHTFFAYPLKAANALRGLGLVEAARCMASYAQARLRPEKDETTFEAWVSNRFGRRLYGIFFKSYSEKLWGISCKELDADFAAQRIKKLSLWEAVKSALIPSSGGKHRTLVDEFAYPLNGAGTPYRAMAAEISRRGGKVHLQTAVDAYVPPATSVGSAALTLSDGRTVQFDHVISTMPITLLVAKLDAPKHVQDHARSLTFRNTILVYLRVASDSPFPDQWIYVHSAELQTGRITNFRNWVPEILAGQSDTILCLEYWCYDPDAIWHAPDEDLVALARSEIYKTGLVPTGTVIDGHVVRVPKCYPVYANDYREHLEPVETFLSTVPKLSVIGRYGAFKYNNQDHSILMGLMAAENIADGAAHDLWGINTDYEYQESSRITATGLANA